MGGCRGVGGRGQSRGQQQKKAGERWEAAEGWEARGERRGQINRRPERGGRPGQYEQRTEMPFLSSCSLSLSLFPALFIPLIQVVSRSVSSASHSSYSLFFSVLFLRTVCGKAACLGSHVSYEL